MLNDSEWKKTAHSFFLSLFLGYLAAVILEALIPGFVSFYLDLDSWLLVMLVFGIFDAYEHRYEFLRWLRH